MAQRLNRHRKAKISQETYDETVLENQDLFDLTPTEAVTETLSQLSQQGIHNLFEYLVTSHPESIEGKDERAARKEFEECLEVLDGVVGDDGQVVLNGEDGDVDDEDRMSVVEGVLKALEGIEGCCRGDTDRGCVVVVEGGGEDNNGGDGAEKVQDGEIDGDGANKEELDGDNTVTPTNGEIESSTTTTTTTTTLPAIPQQNQNRPKRKRRRGEAFLTLLHSTGSMYTLMSLLGAVPLPSSNTTTSTTKSTSTTVVSSDRQTILNAAVRTLTSVLTPRRAVEMETVSLLRNSFVEVMERLVLLMFHYLTVLSHSGGAVIVEEGNVQTLEALVRLATVACRGSERNKVAFVRALKNRRTTTTTTGDDGGNDGEGREEEKEEGPYGRSTIALVVRILSTGLQSIGSPSTTTTTTTTTTTDGSSPTSETAAVGLMTETCRLVTVLCRYDDYSSGGGGGGLGVDSSQGANVSSSHDHVLEFGREGIVPLLQDIGQHSLAAATLVTKTSVTTTTPEEKYKDGGILREEAWVELAGAALAATRVLAVNDEIVQAMVAVGTLKTIGLALDMGVTEISAFKSAEYEEEEEKKGETISDNGSRLLREQKARRKLLAVGAIGLIRNLCGNDEIKTTLCLGSDPSSTGTAIESSLFSSVLPAILQGMRLYRDIASVQEHGCGSLAAMALRKPANALRIVRQDGPREILTAMRQFPGNVLVQRQGALAVRNIVSRLVANPALLIEGEDGVSESAVIATTTAVEGKKESTVVDPTSGGSGDGSGESSISVRDIFLDLGAEVVLRTIAGMHQGSVDEAYAALRDLGCEVSMVKFDAETQKVTSRVAMFGDVKPNFRPVYEESGSVGGVGNVSVGGGGM